MNNDIIDERGRLNIDHREALVWIRLDPKQIGLLASGNSIELIQKGGYSILISAVKGEEA